MIQILDTDLESVIAEAAKLQNRVLESIIGEKTGGEGKLEEETMERLREPSDIMAATEKQLKIHKSEKETFSKGIASIIYNKIEGEDQNMAIDEGYDESKQELEFNEQKNNVVEEVSIKCEQSEVHLQDNLDVSRVSFNKN